MARSWFGVSDKSIYAMKIFCRKKRALVFSLTLFLVSNPVNAQKNTDTITLNLKNADIHALIEMVAKNTGKNFIIDPRVKAKVTVISAEPVSADKLYAIFLSVLQVHGYATIPAGDVIKIVPEITAKQGAIPMLPE